jgi:hypothetical protein
MRIWDLPPDVLCRSHLLGEHRELHAIWTVLTQGKTGYAHHPETLRWTGKLQALHARHEALVQEMEGRGYQHHSPLTPSDPQDQATQDHFVDSVERQLELLRAKGCDCRV